MLCDKCQEPIEAGEEREFKGQQLCEDCYMDVLSPARTCDPWAVHTAKSIKQQDQGGPQVNPKQQEILDVLRETGGLEPSLLAEKVQLKPSDLEREIAALRHMEKVRGELRDGTKVIRLW